MIKKGIPHRYTQELLETMLKAANNTATLDEFLKDILTPAEYETLAVRWQIVKLLADGLTQRDVAQRLHIGIATVTRGSRELYDKQGAFMKLLKPKQDSAWWSRSHT